MATSKLAFPSTKLQTVIHEITSTTPARVPGFSDSFHDLMYRLLAKDPVDRIAWEQLRKHPFWEEEIQARNLPQ
jgi:serine/threonine protein kinase